VCLDEIGGENQLERISRKKYVDRPIAYSAYEYLVWFVQDHGPKSPYPGESTFEKIQAREYEKFIAEEKRREERKRDLH